MYYLYNTNTLLIHSAHTLLRPATLLKKRLWHWRFPVNFEKFLRTSFLQNISGRLLPFLSLFHFLGYSTLITKHANTCSKSRIKNNMYYISSKLRRKTSQVKSYNLKKKPQRVPKQSLQLRNFNFNLFPYFESPKYYILS